MNRAKEMEAYVYGDNMKRGLKYEMERHYMRRNRKDVSHLHSKHSNFIK